MNKSLRYVIYVLIGMGIYFVSGAYQDPDRLSELRAYTPFILLTVVVLIIVIRLIRMRKKDPSE